MDGICQGIGYTVVLLILSAFRELLGAGTLLGIRIMPSSYVPAGMLTLPVGGFLCLGTLLAIMQWALARSETVSYTHLDVYKRQGQYCSHGSSPFLPREGGKCC